MPSCHSARKQFPLKHARSRDDVSARLKVSVQVRMHGMSSGILCRICILKSCLNAVTMLS